MVELDASKREAIDAAWPKITERGLDILSALRSSHVSVSWVLTFAQSTMRAV